MSMHIDKIPLIIRECSNKGVIIERHRLPNVIEGFEVSPMPEDKLKKLTKDELEMYAEALYLIKCEPQYQWNEGFRLLEKLGFEKKSREVGHRCYSRMVYKMEDEND